MQRELITVERFYTEQASALELKLVAGATGLKRIIREPTVNRPGLALAGFTRYFASKRIQVIGNAEATFLKSLPKENRPPPQQDLLGTAPRSNPARTMTNNNAKCHPDIHNL